VSNAEFAGKVALITGASRGIGAATARRLSALGANVVMAARSRDALDALAKELSVSGGTALAVPTDVSVSAELDALIAAVRDRFARLDILVNNAGVMPTAARIERISRGDWESVLAVNLTAPWYLSCRAHDLLAAGGGVIVNVSSTAAQYPSIGLAAYNTSKAALSMMSRSCALEWARDGIRVVTVIPGKTDTEMVRPILDFIENRNIPPNPMKRIGTAEEVAESIAYLVSERAAYITGATLVIDGGELINAAT
jgi:NAD(P)-dependent dehydrogenase (short-subunit alcohol dehydrogenase family)